MPVSDIILYKPTLTEFETTDSLYRFLANSLEEKILTYEAEHGVVRLLLAGGQTPLPLYKYLGQKSSTPWDSVEIYQSDERFIDTISNDSNQKLIAGSLGQDTLELCRSVNFFQTDSTIEASLEDYQERLESLDGVWFDLAIIGIGPDGHFASLFPGGDYLRHQEVGVLATTAPDSMPITERLSLTIESVLNTREIIVILSTPEKELVLSELMEGSLRASQFPAKFLLTHPKVRIYFCLQ